MSDGTETDGTVHKQHTLGMQFAPAWHRPFLRYVEGEQGGGDGGEGKTEAKSFSQDEVNAIVNERLAQQRKNEFGDYADLKAKAEGAKSIEQQLADLQSKHEAAEARALRSDIAARHGISAEDRDLFLTGSDEAALEAQAKRLAERTADEKKNGNRAPKEGRPVKNKSDSGDEELREFATNLFGSAQNE